MTDPLDEAVSTLKADDRIKRHADRTGLDPEFVKRVITQESGGKSNARSWAGAGGTMQLMSGTAKRYGVKNVNDPEENIRGGTDYLRDLTNEFGDPHKVLAAYNAGEGSVRKHGYAKVRKFSNFPKGDPRRGGYEGSTGAYVDKILKGYEGAGYQDPLSDAIKTLKTQKIAPQSDPLDESVAQLKQQPTPTSLRDTTVKPMRPRDASPYGGLRGGAQGEKGFQVGMGDLKRADEKVVAEMYRPRVTTNLPETKVDPRVLKGEQPSNPMEYARAQEAVTRVSPRRSEAYNASMPPSFQPRKLSVLDRIGESVSETVREYAPGIAAIDTPMGIKTDLPRGILSAATLGAVPEREISTEEKLINPRAESEAALASGVGHVAGALVPFTLAGKIVAPLNAPRAVKTAVQFGLVDAGHQVISGLKGQEVDWSSPIIAAGLGAAIGRLEGKDPATVRRVVAFIAPQLALDVAQGTPENQAILNVVTNLGFALSAGGKPKISPRRLGGRANETPATIPEMATIQPRREVSTVTEPIGQREMGNRGPDVDRGIAPDVTSQRRAEQGGVSEPAPTVRHVDLQPRRRRGDGKGQFKEETRTQREERLAKVNPVETLQTPAETATPTASNRPIQAVESGLESGAMKTKTPPVASAGKSVEPLLEAATTPLKGDVITALASPRESIALNVGMQGNRNAVRELRQKVYGEDYATRNLNKDLTVGEAEDLRSSLLGNRRRSKVTNQQIADVEKWLVLHRPDLAPQPAQAKTATTPAVTSGGKQPWEMTAQEFAVEQNRAPWESKFGAGGKNRYGETLEDYVRSLKPEEGFISKETKHRTAIEAAIREGKPIPPEVLADYPELAKQYAAEGGVSIEQRFPKGTQVEYAKPGEISRTGSDVVGRGEVVGYRRDPTTGDTFVEVRTPTGKSEFVGDANDVHKIDSGVSKAPASESEKFPFIGERLLPDPYGPDRRVARYGTPDREVVVQYTVRDGIATNLNVASSDLGQTNTIGPRALMAIRDDIMRRTGVTGFEGQRVSGISPTGRTVKVAVPPAEVKGEGEGKPRNVGTEESPRPLNDLPETITQRLREGRRRSAALGNVVDTESGDVLRLTLRPDTSESGTYSVVMTNAEGRSQPVRMKYKGGERIGEVMGHFEHYLNTDNPGRFRVDLEGAKTEVVKPVLRRNVADVSDKAELKRLNSLQFRTRGNEIQIERLKARIAADPAKWGVGDGVGWKVSGQTNRGFRVIEVRPETKQVVIRSVADTGLTTSGGNYDKIGDQLVHISDLVRDNKYNAAKVPEAAKPTGVSVPEGPRREFVIPRAEVTRPLAAEGLTSYRYRPDTGGQIAIGAKNNAEALTEAARSLSSGKSEIAKLDVWDGEKYVPVSESAPQSAPKVAETPTKAFDVFYTTADGHRGKVLGVEANSAQEAIEIAKADDPAPTYTSAKDMTAKYGVPEPETGQSEPPKPLITSAREQEGPRGPTAVKDKTMQAKREMLGLPELERLEPQRAPEVLAKAERENAADPHRPDALVEQALKGGKNWNNIETMQVNLRAVDLENRIEKLQGEIYKETDPRVIAEKAAEQDGLIAQFGKLSEASDLAGAEWSRAGTARKLALNSDFSLAAMVTKAKKTLKRDLTTEERSRYESQSWQIKDLEAKLVEANEKAEQAKLQKTIDRVKRQNRRQETKAVLDTEFASLKAMLAQAKLETRSGVQPSLLAGLDPEGKLTPIIARMAKNRVKAGVNSAEALVSEVYNAVKDHYDVSREDIAGLIRGTLHESDDVLSSWDKRRQTQLLKQYGEIEGKLTVKDYSGKSPREPPIYNRETARLQRQVDEIKQKFSREMYRATRSTGGRISDELAKAAGVGKTIKSMGDISAVFRQGGYLAITHPVNGLALPLRDMVKSFSDAGWRNVENHIKSHPDYKTLKDAGTEFTGVDRNDPNLSKHEEGYLGREWLDYIPVAKQVSQFSERTFVSFLDAQRLYVGSKMLRGLTDPGIISRTLGAKRGLSPSELTADRQRIARAINSATGRGNLGKAGNQAAPLLNIVMFSPRLLKSRVELLNNMFNPVAWRNMPRNARAEILQDNVKFLAGTVAVMALAKTAGGTVNTDPDDGDFLKIRFGDTTYDTLTGLQQPLRYMINMTRALSPIDSATFQAGPTMFTGKDAWEQTVGTKTRGGFLESKASPLLSNVIETVRGSDFSGRKRGLRERAVDVITPLPARDVVEAFQREGLLGAIKATPTFTGIGVNTYPVPPDKPTNRAEKLASKYRRDAMPPGRARDEEEIELSGKMGELRARSRSGGDVTDTLNKLKTDGVISEKQAKSVLSSRGVARLQEYVKRLPLYDPKERKDALTIYETSTPEQRESLKKIIGEKAITVDLMPVDDQQAVRDKLKGYGFKPGLQIPKRPERPARPNRPNPRAWSVPQ